MDDRTLGYWVGFSRVRGIGPIHLKALIDHFGSVEKAWNAAPSALREIGLEQRALENLIHVRQHTDLDAELRTLRRLGVDVIPLPTPAYPPLLRTLHDAPSLLYLKGALTEADSRAIAIVGTRRATSYGKAIAAELATGLARQGITVISGLARGIDGIAHQAALEAGGRTIAVLANGLDQVYPPEHHALAQAIAAQGALISELPIGSPPDKRHFVPRNRLISGMALGVVVVEASESSGALKTADLALDQGREVFAVPGNTSSPVSRGTNALIRSGAKIVLGIEDILNEIDPGFVLAAPRSRPTEARATEPYVTDDPIEAALLHLLSEEPQNIDTLAQQSGFPVGLVGSALTRLELREQIRQNGNLQFTCV